MKGGGDGLDVRRLDRQQRYKASLSCHGGAEGDLTSDYLNIIGMIFSLCGIMLRLKWCAWAAVFSSCVCYASTKTSENTKQIFSNFMLSISSVIMSYLQNPQPMSPPWAVTYP